MKVIFYYFIFIFFVFSCERFTVNDLSGETVVIPASALSVKPAVRPLAVLKTGKQPLWFMLTEDGPVHLESIEDAVYSAAFIPWTFALHIRFFEVNEVNDGEIVMAVNHGGFLKLAPTSAPDTEGLALYQFSGGEYWKRYTIGSFIFYDGKPVVVLYIDDHFLDSNDSIPSPRTWTFNMESNIPFPLEIPALEVFHADENWEVNTLRLGNDGFWYYRVIKKYGREPEMRMLRAVDLSGAGVDTSLEDFQNSAPRRTEINNPLLPPLPKGYVYTGEAVIGDNLFACWEEQEGYSIGAAGFMVMKH